MKLTPGPARLLWHLERDARYSFHIVTCRPPPLKGAAGLVGLTLAAERKIIPARMKFTSEYSDNKDKIVSGLSIAEARTSGGEPDLIVDFSMASAAEGLGPLARFGLWRLDSFSEFAGFAEAFRGDPVIAVALYRQDVGQRHEIASTLYDTKKLASHAQVYIREKSVQLIISEIAKLQAGAPPLATAGASKDAQKPSGRAALTYVIRTLCYSVSHVLGGARTRHGLFRLATGKGDVTDFDPSKTQEVAVPDGVFWADPFLFKQDGSLYCFFEEFSYAENTGHIAVGLISETGIDYIGKALSKPYHLSFPFIFRHGDDVFMIPETTVTNRVEIWRATDFPTGWTLHSTILEGVRTADTTLTEISGEWWLFTNVGHDGFGDHCNELCVYRVSGPDLAWAEPHALNPVVIGTDRARNGGRLLEKNGKHYRLAQDNSGGNYGHALKVMEIEELTLSRYSEKCVRRILPDFRAGIIGCHHFDAIDGHFVIDVKYP